MQAKKYRKLIIFNFTLLELVIVFFLLIRINNFFIVNHGYVYDSNKTKDITLDTMDNFDSIILHPYLGFVENSEKDIRLNKFGFIGPEPFSKKSDNKLIVGIFGGSIAKNYYQEEKRNLIKKLNSIPYFKDKTIDLFCISGAGYKQPQQLMALNYFLVLGAQFDIVVNIDGFNEVALANGENVANGVSSFFPRMWNFYSKKSLNMESVLLVNSINKHKKNMDNLKSLLSNPLVKYFKFIPSYFYIEEQNAINNENNELAIAINKDDNSYQTKGPEAKYFSPQEIKRNIINVWKESSIQMNNLAKANDIQYFHFLLPNQYVINSKTFTSEEEKKFAYNEYNPYKKSVEEFYPYLIKEGGELSKLGIQFTDLTMIYKNNKNTVYEDNCCHINPYGNSIITDVIVKIFSEKYKN